MTDNIYERLQAIETRLDSLEGRAGAQQNLLLKQQKALSDLEAKVDTEANIRHGQAQAIGRLNVLMDALGRRTLKFKDDLHNHDARLSDLEGEDRKVVLESSGEDANAGQVRGFANDMNKLRNIRERIRGYWEGKQTSDELANDLDRVIQSMDKRLGFDR